MSTSTMTTTAWQRTTHRQRALRSVLRRIEADPAALGEIVSEACRSDFGSLDDLLLAAHQHWMRTHDARVDSLLEQGAHGDQAAFDAAWTETARLLDGVARLLDHFAEHPAVVRGHARHARRIKAMCGVDLPSTFRPASARRHRARRRGRRCRLPQVRVA